jgi:hypothetical protein
MLVEQLKYCSSTELVKRRTEVLYTSVLRTVVVIFRSCKFSYRKLLLVVLETTAVRLNVTRRNNFNHGKKQNLI